MSVPSLNEALALMNQGAFTDARAICQQHLAHRADNFNARHLLGLIQFKGGNLIAATKELTKASKMNPAPRFKAQAFNNLALVLQARGKLEQATAACHSAIHLQPGEMAFHLNLLGLLERQHGWSDIVQHMQATPLLSSNEEALLFHAVALRHQRAHAEALDILASLDSSIEVESERALNLCLLHDSETVIGRWQAGDADPERLILIADYIAEEGHAAAATPLYEIVAQANPNNLSVRHMLNAAQGTCTAEAPSDYVRRLYDTHAQQFESRLQGQLDYNAPELLCRHLASMLDHEHLINAADLGCGTGLCGAELRKQLSIDELSGCDLSSQMLQLAAQKQVYNTLSCCALIDFLQTLKPVELITATDVLIYTGNLKPVIEAIPGVLKPGGLFAFTVERHKGTEEVCLHTSGRYRHSQRHIEILAEQQGLRVKLIEPFPLRLENSISIEGLMVILQRV
ncbi:methyltransferase [Marinobacterium sediminicola]|uniref:Predicted methyltransferase, contains TPR repeat n=1 Tax=Marinobacterium sediminicola TaxID=518898 RepID=A0ABY1RWE1_9GAMM|nr:methyltransferase [Marinobacterium sediminicola]ULG70345.1 methyltransferase [Marinobacterium sediminicola]SMR69665.1 Predicted methyltransferase, contains TPR repeat [Marinobacterium sediminicola]